MICLLLSLTGSIHSSVGCANLKKMERKGGRKTERQRGRKVNIKKIVILMLSIDSFLDTSHYTKVVLCLFFTNMWNIEGSNSMPYILDCL
jgi:hypothetical protein